MLDSLPAVTSYAGLRYCQHIQGEGRTDVRACSTCTSRSPGQLYLYFSGSTHPCAQGNSRPQHRRCICQRNQCRNDWLSLKRIEPLLCCRARGTAPTPWSPVKCCERHGAPSGRTPSCPAPASSARRPGTAARTPAEWQHGMSRRGLTSTCTPGATLDALSALTRLVASRRRYVGRDGLDHVECWLRGWRRLGSC